MFLLAELPFDTATLATQLRCEHAGAFVSFEGWVRNHNDGRTVVALEYEAYSALALREGRRILDEALARYEIAAARCVHRTGRLVVAEPAVWVGVSAPHRDAAFAACRYIIDEVKLRVPIWKKEFYADGESEWVNCAHCARHDGHALS